MKVTTRTTQTITLADERLGEIDLPFVPLDASDIFLSEDGKTLTYLADDPEGGYDYEFPEGVQFVQGKMAYNHYCNDASAWLEEVNADPNLDVYPVGVYEHGLIQYSLAGESMMSNDRWDYCVGACIAIPTDFTDTEEAARSILEEYTNWCNGSVFGIVEMVRQESGDWEEGDTCWGFIGYEYAVEEAKAQVG